MREFTNPAYIAPGGGGSTFTVQTVAHATARLALPQLSAAGSAVRQADDGSVWGLKANGIASVSGDWLLLAPSLASLILTGTPTAPTAPPGTNTTQLATTAFAQAAADLKAPLASPALTGTPTAPTAVPGTNTTQLATTAFAKAADDLKAPLASPALTGTPTAPTATLGTNTTQLATTAFATAGVVAAVGTAKTLSVTDAFNNVGAPVLCLDMYFQGFRYGKPYHYHHDGMSYYWSQWNGTYWELRVGMSVWLSYENVATADWVDTWIPSVSASASPTVTPVLVSPVLTGTPTAPTAASGTNTTQLATTAFVKASAVTQSDEGFTATITTSLKTFHAATATLDDVTNALATLLATLKSKHVI